MLCRVSGRSVWLLGVALGLLASLAVPVPPAGAELRTPPPAIDQWPRDPARECATSAQRDHGAFRTFCRFWHTCETATDLTDEEVGWCRTRSSALELRQRCYGPTVFARGQPTARSNPTAGPCRHLLENRWKPVCIDSAVRAETSKWSCRQTQAISLADWEEAWRRHDCMEMLDAPGRVEEMPERSVEFCGYYGHDRYDQLCRGSGVEEGTLPTQPTDRDRFCLLWTSSAVNPNGGCVPNPDTAAEAKRCRAYNEERWRQLGCSATTLDYGEGDFCWKYGWQRYDDFCRPDTSASPDPTHRPPLATPPGEERPEGIDEFCSEWESGPWADAPRPSDVPGSAGEGPGAAGADEEVPLQGAPDIFSELGARSPFCDYPQRLSASARRACQLSGSIAHEYPLAHYGLDYHGDDGEASLTDVDLAGIATGMVQTVLNLVWTGFLYLMKGVLLLLEWAFEVPIVGGCASDGIPSATTACDDQLPEIPRALLDLYEELRPWLVVAFAVAGLWGLWNGLVRQKVSYTLGSLLGTVVLISVGLAIVSNPVGTVGWLARVANDASLGVLDAATRPGGDTPTGSFADAQEGLFDTLVTRPWCALQFGDVAWCTQEDEASGVAPADVWLAWPAGGEERVALYKYMKGEEVENTFWNKLGDTWAYTWRFGCIFDSRSYVGEPTECDEIEGNSDRRDEMIERQEALEAAMGGTMGPAGESAARVALQEKQGTPTRAPLLGLIVLTQLGAILVLGRVGVKLFMAAVLVLVLLLLAPVMMLAPAFGEAGRNGFLLWLKRLGAAALAKLVLAIVLTILLLVAGVLAGLGLGWFPVWLLQAGFWWGVLLKRRQLDSLVDFDVQEAMRPQPRAGGLGGVLGNYIGYWALSGGAGAALRTVGAPVRALRANRAARRQAESRALRSGFARLVNKRAAEGLGQRRTVLEAKEGRIARRIGQIRAQREANQERLERARLHEQQAPAGMRARLQRLEDKRRGLEQLRKDKAQEVQAREQRLAELDARRASLVQRGRGRELTALDRERWHAATELERSRDEARAVDERLARLDPHLQRARDQVTNYQPRRSSAAPQVPEARGKRLEVERLEREDERLRDEEARLLAEQSQIRGELRSLPDEDSTPSGVQAQRWWDQRRMALDLGADPAGAAQLEAAGIDPDEYARATEAEQGAMRARSQRAMEADRRLLERFDADPPPDLDSEARKVRGEPRYADDRARFEAEERRRRQERRRRGEP